MPSDGSSVRHEAQRPYEMPASRREATMPVLGPGFESWRVWRSDEGVLYATRSGLAGRGSGTTVHAGGLDGLRRAVAFAEKEAALASYDAERLATLAGFA